MDADDIRKILGLLAAYCQTVDQRRMDDHLELYADDCRLEVFGRTYEGKARVRRFMENSHVGQHLTGVPLILEEGTDGALVTSDFVFFRDDLLLFTAGTYHDELRRSDDAWRFVSRRIEMRIGPPSDSD
jgi:3-phenylpropionate/cinnamic acid dioxygenase small subunit